MFVRPELKGTMLWDRLRAAAAQRSELREIRQLRELVNEPSHLQVDCSLWDQDEYCESKEQDESSTRDGIGGPDMEELLAIGTAKIAGSSRRRCVANEQHFFFLDDEIQAERVFFVCDEEDQSSGNAVEGKNDSGVHSQLEKEIVSPMIIDSAGPGEESVGLGASFSLARKQAMDRLLQPLPKQLTRRTISKTDRASKASSWSQKSKKSIPETIQGEEARLRDESNETLELEARKTINFTSKSWGAASRPRFFFTS